MMREITRKGQFNPKAKLSDLEAIQVVKRINNGESGAAVARDFNISTAAALAIFHGKSRPAARAAVEAELSKSKKRRN
jgi:hypothetical protein